MHLICVGLGFRIKPLSYAFEWLCARWKLGCLPMRNILPSSFLYRVAASLETSVTVACRPRVVGSAVSFKDVRGEVEEVVKQSVKRFWSYGFRGTDLIVACYGPAVGVFGRYERVEKADGTPVDIPELLELARQAARDAIAGEFRGDNLSTLYKENGMLSRTRSNSYSKGKESI